MVAWVGYGSAALTFPIGHTRRIPNTVMASLHQAVMVFRHGSEIFATVELFRNDRPSN